MGVGWLHSRLCDTVCSAYLWIVRGDSRMTTVDPFEPDGEGTRDDQDTMSGSAGGGSWDARGMWHPPEAPEQSVESGALVDFDRMTTQKLLPLQRYREMSQSRSRRVDHHRQLAAVQRENAADLQRALYELAERISDVNERFTLLHVCMEPTLDQIRQMRDLQQQLAQMAAMIASYRKRYEWCVNDAMQHERAMVALEGREGSGREGA